MNTVFSTLQKKLSSEYILVLGLGRQGGVKVVNRLIQLGARVRVSDRLSAKELSEPLKQIKPEAELKLGSEDLSLLDGITLVVKNPAVPSTHPIIQTAKQRGIRVTSETALALAPVSKRVIGVTGTRGKTTTSHLIFHLLQQAGKTVVIGGNIPQQPTLETILNAPENAYIVLELSSFQLESLEEAKISPHTAVLTSLSPDHLNRYGTLESYIDAKANIFRWQKSGDKAFWLEDPKHPDWMQRITHSVPQDVVAQEISQQDVEISRVRDSLSLAGEHNVRNAALAFFVGRSLGISAEILHRGLGSFPGVDYRQQVIPTKDEIVWINDTTATTPTALLTAVKTFSDRNFILIAGGTTKHLPFPEELTQKIRSLQDRIVWLSGSGTNELLSQLHIVPQKTFDRMNEAVDAARAKAKELSADTIVLSPGFSSFDFYTNEFDRGDQFNQAVQVLNTSQK